MGCQKSTSLQNENSDIKFTTEVIKNYSQDAAQLYFNEVYKNPGHSNYNNPVIDSSQIYKVLEIIQAVYNSNSPQRDTVFNIYKIHGYYCVSFNSVYLKVNPELKHIQNLSKGIIPTGNADFDLLLAKYGFDSVKTSYSYPDFNWLIIQTKKSFNMLPVANEFKNTPGVLNSDFSRGCIGDGNSISLKRGVNSATIIFNIGSGDCPAGCIYKRFWEFLVDKSGAKFIRAY